MMRSSPKTMAYIFYLLIKGPLLPLPLPCLLSLSCLDGHLLRLTLAACNADPLRAAPFTNREHNREDPILELRLDIVGIDRPGEGDHPFKCAGDDFSREPVVSTPMAFRLALLCLLSTVLLRLLLALRLARLRLLLARCLTRLRLLLARRLTRLRLLLGLRLTLGLVLMLVLMAEATS